MGRQTHSRQGREPRTTLLGSLDVPEVDVLRSVHQPVPVVLTDPLHTADRQRQTAGLRGHRGKGKPHRRHHHDHHHSNQQPTTTPHQTINPRTQTHTPQHSHHPPRLSAPNKIATPTHPPANSRVAPGRPCGPRRSVRKANGGRKGDRTAQVLFVLGVGLADSAASDSLPAMWFRRAAVAGRAREVLRRALPARRFGPVAAVDVRDAPPVKGPHRADPAGGRLRGGAA